MISSVSRFFGIVQGALITIGITVSFTLMSGYISYIALCALFWVGICDILERRKLLIDEFTFHWLKPCLDIWWILVDSFLFETARESSVSHSSRSLFGWGCKIHRLHFCRGVRPHLNECPGYDIKQSVSEAAVMLTFWGIVIAPRSILALSSSTWKGAINGSNRTVWHLKSEKKMNHAKLN